jgi:hypothetical protein
MANENLQIAFLAEGKLYVKRGVKAPQLLESPFAQNIIDRATQAAERHGWRDRSGNGPPGMFSSSLIWGRAMPQKDVRKVRITGVSRAPQTGNLLYALVTGAVGGLFTYDLAAEHENRLFHKQEFRAEDLAHHPAKELVALSLPNEDGTAGIAIMQPGGRGLRPITEGDALDQAPSWVPSPDDPQREVLVYQSAGIARNQRGQFGGIGPYSICRLDIDKARLTTLLEDPKWDYLVPRIRLEDGKEILYFIRRPYKLEGQSTYSPLKLLLDIVLFPFRLLRAIFAFLNVFSMFFSQKPLTTAGGPKTEDMDMRFVQLYGKWIDVNKALKSATKGQAVSLVPNTWELVRMDADGKLTVLAPGVLSFDLAPDGTVVYTNGSEIFTISDGGKPERLCAHRMIQHVMALG